MLLEAQARLFAFDMHAAPPTLVWAANLCWKAGVTKYAHPLRADMVGGHPREDRQDSAQLRLRHVPPSGVIPTRMLHRGPFSAVPNRPWRWFQRSWAPPAIAGFVGGVIRFAAPRGCEQRTHSSITGDARSHLVMPAGRRNSARKRSAGNCQGSPSPRQ